MNIAVVLAGMWCAWCATVDAIPPPHPRVLEARDEEQYLPEHQRSPAWYNPHLRKILPLTSLLHHGEKLVYDRDTDNIDRGEIYKMLTHAGLVARRPNSFRFNVHAPRRGHHQPEIDEFFDSELLQHL